MWVYLKKGMKWQTIFQEKSKSVFDSCAFAGVVVPLARRLPEPQRPRSRRGSAPRVSIPPSTNATFTTPTPPKRSREASGLVIAIRVGCAYKRNHLKLYKATANNFQRISLRNIGVLRLPTQPAGIPRASA